MERELTIEELCKDRTVTADRTTARLKDWHRETPKLHSELGLRGACRSVGVP